MLTFLGKGDTEGRYVCIVTGWYRFVLCNGVPILEPVQSVQFSQYMLIRMATPMGELVNTRWTLNCLHLGESYSNDLYCSALR